MKTLQSTQLQAISGGVCTTACQQQAAERALINEQHRPEVIKESVFSALFFGVTAAGGTIMLSAGAPLAATVGLSTALYVGYTEYMGHELWVK